MAVTIRRMHLRRWSTPLGLRTARGLMAVRRGWHVGLEADGRCGWGDVAPWPGFGAGEAAVAAALDTLDLRQTVVDRDLLRRLPAAAAHGVEQALLDLMAQLMGSTLAELLVPRPARRVATHRLVTDADAARAAVADGATALKIKLGAASLDDDDARVAAIRAAAPETPLRLDANGGWDRETAARAVDRLARHRPAWIEQPLPADDLDGFVALRDRSPVPLALDESVALHGVATLALAPVIVIKPMFVGGLRPARDLALAARRRGAAVCITHALDSAVGRLGALHLAAGLEGPDGRGVHGLAGAPPTAPIGPSIPLPDGPGLGYAPPRAEAA